MGRGILLVAWMMVAASVGVAMQRPQPPQRRFTVANPSLVAREEVVRVTLPFAPGELASPCTFAVRPVGVLSAAVEPSVGRSTPLIRWPDGSIAALQLHVRLAVPSSARTEYRAEAVAEKAGPRDGDGAEDAVTSPFNRLSELASSVVADAWGREWTARLKLGEPVVDTGLVRMRPILGEHRLDAAAFLGLSGYLTTFEGERRAELTLRLDNLFPANGLPDERALGPVRFRSWSLVTSDSNLRFLPRFARDSGMAPPVALTGGGFRQVLVAADPSNYLGDGTAKTVRLDLFFDDEDVDDSTRTAAAEAVAAPLRPLPVLDEVRQTGAFGAHGGPAPRLSAREDLSSRMYAAWRSSARLGPFGGFGDREDAAAQGSARSGGSILHNAIRWQNPELLPLAEAMVLQHSLRPPPGRRPRLPADTAPFRTGLGPRAIASPHGFTALDYEHFAVGLLFDWYWLTGDPVARDELARMGRGLLPLLDAVPFLTCRGEGWCLQGGVLIARATDDPDLVRRLARRFEQRVLPVLSAAAPGVVLPQPPHAEVLDGRQEFDLPWQMAALIHGLHALKRAPGVTPWEHGWIDAAVTRAADAMATSGWMEGEGPKYLVSSLRSDRYMMPVGYHPLAGTACLQVGAFGLAAEMTGTRDQQRLWRGREETILAFWLSNASPEWQAHVAGNPWFQVSLDRQAGGAR